MVFSETVKKWVIVFIQLSIFLVLSYNVVTNSVTTDEPAHIGAAWMYSKGLEENIEHPVLLKFLNSVLFSTVFSNISTEAREQYQVGWELLSGDKGYEILILSRSIYAIAFFLGLIWLTYAWYKKQIGFELVTLLLIIIGLSPLISPHASLVTFDAFASLSSCIFLYLCWEILNNTLSIHSKHKNNIFLWRWWGIWFALGVLSKYSLLYLIAPAVTVIVICVIKFRIEWKFYISKLFSLLLLTIFFIGILYSYCFRNAKLNIPPSVHNELAINTIKYWNNSPLLIQQATKPFLLYAKGAVATFVRSEDSTSQFIQGETYSGSFGGMFMRVYPYKESVVTLLILLFGCVLLVHQIFKKKLNVLTSLLPIIIYTGAFFYTAFKSHLLIGIRHIYPALTGMYLLSLIMILNLKIFYQHRFINIFAITYFVHILAVPLSLSYTNPLWTRERWVLVGDSAMIWGQDVSKALNYLTDKNLLANSESSDWEMLVHWAPLKPYQYARLYNFKQNLVDYRWSDRELYEAVNERKKNILVDASFFYNTTIRASNSLKGYVLMHQFGETIFWYRIDN